MSQVGDNVKRLMGQIEGICTRLSRSPSEITVVAVAKTVPPHLIQEAVRAGIEIVGENRVQEAAAKVGLVDGGITWHMVGHLQRNKVKKAVTIFDMIQSVDSYELVCEIDKRCEQTAKIMDILVEVNTSGEETKFGVMPDATVDLVESISHLKNVHLRGLMTIGAFTDDESLIRRCFRTLGELQQRVTESNISNVDMEFLSMGMTSDFELAIEEGSNMVRIGTAIFGARQG